MALLEKGPRDDVDFCEEAVARCKASGIYDKAEQADARGAIWFRLAVWSRIALLAGTIAGLTWYGVVQPIRRKVRTSPR